MSQFNEATLEQAIIDKFIAQGYQYSSGDNLHRELTYVLIKDDLFKFLLDRYASEGITSSEATSIIQSLKTSSAQPLYDANMKTFLKMVEGEVFVREDRNKKDFFLQLIDFDNPMNNSFRIVNQMTVKSNTATSLKNGLGVTDKDLETGWISISPYYEWVDGQRTLVGQKASQSVKVKTSKVDRAGEVYEILAKIDGISVSSVSMDKEDKSEARFEARRKAVEMAKAKAMDYAEALGVQVVGVMSVTDNGSQGYAPYYSNAVMFKTAAADYDAGSGTELYAGDVVITESVDVVFSIR